MNISLAAEPIFHIGNFPVSNTLIMSLAVSVFFLIFSVALSQKLRLIPRGVQNAMEYVLDALLVMVDSVTQNRKQSEKFFPLVASIFLFVILSNWIELVPGLGTIGIWESHNGEEILIPFIRSSSADLNVTLAIAVVAVVAIQLAGISALGVWQYGKKFFVSPFHKPYFVGTFVGFLELISEAAKIISFSFRLFGNIFAGEVLLMVVLTLIPYFVPLPFLFLELFVGFVQALVFSMLTLVFLKMAAEKAH